MTKTLLQTTTVYDRLVSLTQNVVLFIVGKAGEGFVVIEDQTIPDTDKEIFTTVGGIRTFDQLDADGFYKVLEVAPAVGDAVLVRNSADDNKLVAGQVVAVSTHLVSVAPVAKPGAAPVDGDRMILANRKDAYVIMTMPREEPGTFKLDQPIVVINMIHTQFGKVGGVVGLPNPGNAKYLIEFADDSVVELHAASIAPYTRKEQIKVLTSEDLNTAQAAAFFDEQTAISKEAAAEFNDAAAPSVDESTLFNAEFTPRSTTHPQADGDDYEPLDDVFSDAEATILKRMEVVDEHIVANAVGIVIYKGRIVDDAVLRALLAEGIPYGFSQFVPDATEFFRQVGEVVIEQTDKKIEYLLANGGVPDYKALTLTDPSEIVFARITGFDQDQAEAVFNRELDNQDVEDFVDQYAQNAVDSYKAEPEAAASAAPDKDYLDAMFGENGYRLLDRAEVLQFFGEEAAAEHDEGAIFGEAVYPNPFVDQAKVINDLIRDGDAAFADVFGEKKKVPAPEVLSHRDVLDVEGDAGIDIDECLSEFSTMAQAGRVDSHILAKQIGTQVEKHRTLVEGAVADLGSLSTNLGQYLNGEISGQVFVPLVSHDIENLVAALRLLVETNAETESLSGNALMIADAFDALVIDVTNWQSTRAV